MKFIHLIKLLNSIHDYSRISEVLKYGTFYNVDEIFKLYYAITHYPNRLSNLIFYTDNSVIIYSSDHRSQILLFDTTGEFLSSAIIYTHQRLKGSIIAIRSNQSDKFIRYFNI